MIREAQQNIAGRRLAALEHFVEDCRCKGKLAPEQATSIIEAGKCDIPEEGALPKPEDIVNAITRMQDKLFDIDPLLSAAARTTVRSVRPLRGGLEA